MPACGRQQGRGPGDVSLSDEEAGPRRGRGAGPGPHRGVAGPWRGASGDPYPGEAEVPWSDGKGGVGSSQQQALSGFPGAGSDSEAKSGGPGSGPGSWRTSWGRGCCLCRLLLAAGLSAPFPGGGVWQLPHLCSLLGGAEAARGAQSRCLRLPGSPVPACCPLWGCGQCGRSLGGLSVGLCCL